MDGDNYFQPLTNDYNESLNKKAPSSNNYSNQNLPPIQVNQQFSADGTIIIYKTPCNAGIFMMIFCYIYIILFGSVISFMMFYKKVTIYFCFIPLIFPLLGFSGLMFATIATYINYDKYFGTIIIKKKKSLFCFNRKKQIQLNDIEQIIVESYMESGEDNDFPYFRIKFKLKNGNEIEACHESNDNGEGKRVFMALKNTLPQNTPFGGNLVN